MKLNKNIDNNINILKDTLRVDESFDLVSRTIKIKNRTSCLFFIDGFIKDEVFEKILEFFFDVTDENFLADPHTFSENCVPYVEVDISDDINKLVQYVLSGMILLLIDGFDKCIIIDARTYPHRSVEEPVKDKVLRGSRDGFVETLVSNTALIRRRIRDPQLTIKIFTIGNVSKTDVCLCYMDNKVDKKLLNKISNSLKNSNVEALTMNQESLVEAIYPHKWYNPFPKIKYSERPDSTASSIIEGNIAILVDNAPAALILPTSIFDLLEEADDYYFPPFTGTYLRITRFLVTFATLFLTPVWLLFLQNPQITPNFLKFLLVDSPINIPIFWQLILLEIIIDGLRLAALNTPTFINTSLSIIGAIILSEFAVDTGWFSTESLLYMAFVAMANYSQPNFELGYSLKFMRIFLLILTYIINIWGFIAGIIIIFAILALNKTVSGKSYLYPLIPFDGKELLRKLIRVDMKKLNN